MFMTVKQAAEKWGLSDRRVRILCAEGKIPGAFQEGRGWKIPMDAVKPADGRFKSTESLLNGFFSQARAAGSIIAEVLPFLQKFSNPLRCQFREEHIS